MKISSVQLKRAYEIQTKIDALQASLEKVLSDKSLTVMESEDGSENGDEAMAGKRKLSPKARKAIAAGQHKRWEKFHAEQAAKASVTETAPTASVEATTPVAPAKTAAAPAEPVAA